MFQFQLGCAVDSEKGTRFSIAACWDRARVVEADAGRPFGEVVHELRLKYPPSEIPGRLGVSKYFLYEYFGWAMDKIAYVERTYALPLGAVVAQRRAEGAAMDDLAREWGLAVTTLYNALRRFAGRTIPEHGDTADYRTAER